MKKPLVVVLLLSFSVAVFLTYTDVQRLDRTQDMAGGIHFRGTVQVFGGHVMFEIGSGSATRESLDPMVPSGTLPSASCPVYLIGR